MKIVSLNTWKNEGRYQSRLAAAVLELQRLDPDVVLLQECFVCEETGDDTAEVIAESLGVQPYYAPARRKLRWHAGALRPCESGLAVLSRWPVEDCWKMALPSSEEGGERIAMFAQLRTELGPLGCVCVHFSHLGEELQLRQDQIECVLRSLGKALSRGPVVMGGDFNCSPDSQEVRNAEQAFQGNLVNSLPRLGILDPTSPPSRRPEREGRQIDQIWLLHRVGAGELHLRSGGVVPSGRSPSGEFLVSDHALVWVEAEQKLF